MLKIRLMRIGARKRPFYRVVVVNEQAKRTGGYVELVGSYNPLSEPKDIKLKQDRIDHWIKQGAQPSTGYLRIIGKAPQRLPRKPKKEKKEAAPATPTAETPAPKTESVPQAEETTTPSTEETPKEVESQAVQESSKSEVEQENQPEKTADMADAPKEETPAEQSAETIEETPKTEESTPEKS